MAFRPQHVLAAFLAALTLLCPLHAFAADEPTFRLTFDKSGVYEGSISFVYSIDQEYRLCSGWCDGMMGVALPGWMVGDFKAKLPSAMPAATPRELFELRRSIKGLQPGERLQFYAWRSSGSGTDGEGVHAVLNSVDDGRWETTINGETRRDQNTLPRSLNADAELIRLPSGALLKFKDCSMHCGGHGWFDCVSLDAPLTEPSDVKLDFLTFRLTEQDLDAWEHLSKSKQRDFHMEDAPVGSLSITVKLSAELPDLGEVSLEIKDYEKWKPEGNLGDYGAQGNEAVLEAKVKRTGKDVDLPNRKVRLRFEWLERSAEPGVCMNAPRATEGQTDAKEDLDIDPNRNKDLEMLPGKGGARTRGAVSKAEVRISCYDFGAWGKLKVSAKSEDGHPVAVRFRDRKAMTAEITLPLDENGNHIADVWEDEMGCRPAKGSEDEDDTPVGNGFKGDGLTVYEEYRGFKVKGGHLRTNPRKKDLFIADRTGRFGAGVDRFEKLTELVVHRVEGEELNADRLVNWNHAKGPHAVDQHGLVMIDGPKGASAMAVPADPDNDIEGPPGTTRAVRIPLNLSFANPDQPEEDPISVVAHELCHAVGVDHHGGGSMDVRVWRFTDTPQGTVVTEFAMAGDADTQEKDWKLGISNGAIRIYSEDGKPLARPQDLTCKPYFSKAVQGWVVYVVTSPGGEPSGVEDCIMRYRDFPYVSKADPSVRYVPDVSKSVRKNTLCTSKEGTGGNAAWHTPQSRYGNATKGDCKHQVVVNDAAIPVLKAQKAAAQGGPAK